MGKAVVRNGSATLPGQALHPLSRIEKPEGGLPDRRAFEEGRPEKPGEMPPEDVENPPSTDESAEIVEWIAARIKEDETARLAKRDKVSYNRLTVEEYVNTVHDLIGVQFNATKPGGFTADPKGRCQSLKARISVLSRSPIGGIADLRMT